MRSRLTLALRWLGARRAMLPLTTRLICAGLVRESPMFLLRELRRGPGVRIYRLRRGGLRVAIRHQGVDAATLAEVFYHRYYEPPEQVASALGEPAEILDLGANVGLFGAFALARWPAARIDAYEPDPANAAVHERAIEVNGLADRWRLVRAAAGSRDDEVQFAAGLGVASHVLDGVADGETGTTTVADAETGTTIVALHDVLPRIADADLLKLDVEGGEWEILYDPRFAQHPPRAVVLEYHPLRCPEPDPRAAAERALTAAGLQTASIWHGSDGHGMLWGWRR